MLTAFVTAGAAANGQVEPFVAFDPTAGEFPESITTDKTGDLYVSMSVLDQEPRRYSADCPGVRLRPA